MRIALVLSHKIGDRRLENANRIQLKLLIQLTPTTYPVAGDWNGDGVDGVGIYDQDTNTFYLRNDLSSGPSDYGLDSTVWRHLPTYASHFDSYRRRITVKNMMDMRGGLVWPETSANNATIQLGFEADALAYSIRQPIADPSSRPGAAWLYSNGLTQIGLGTPHPLSLLPAARNMQRARTLGGGAP